MHDQLEDMARIFSIFHDGSVESWSFDGNDLKLAIDILYLAERIDPGYRTFYVTIFDITHLEFERWMNDQSPVPRLYDIHEIFQAQLEILEGRVVGQGIVVNWDSGKDSFQILLDRPRRTDSQHIEQHAAEPHIFPWPKTVVFGQGSFPKIDHCPARVSRLDLGQVFGQPVTFVFKPAAYRGRIHGMLVHQ